LRAALDHAGDKLPAALKHPNDARLVTLVARALAADGAADQRLVDFDMRAGAAERVVAVERSHILADFVAHAPRGLVSHAERPLDFGSGHAVAARREHVHDQKPVAQRRAGALERRPGHRRDLVAAMLARVNLAGADAVIAGILAALRALKALAEPGAHQMLKAVIFSHELVQKLAERRSLGGRVHASWVAECST